MTWRHHKLVLIKIFLLKTIASLLLGLSISKQLSLLALPDNVRRHRVHPVHHLPGVVHGAERSRPRLHHLNHLLRVRNCHPFADHLRGQVQELSAFLPPFFLSFLYLINNLGILMALVYSNKWAFDSWFHHNYNDGIRPLQRPSSSQCFEVPKE